MIYKTIKISEEKYIWLLNMMAQLQKERGKRITFDDALDNVIKEKIEKRSDIMKLAGSWKMSDKEAEELITGIYKERRIKSRRL